MSDCPISIINIITVFKELSLLTFGAVGAYVAWKGLQAWKEKITWAYENELKRNILVELYRLENSIEEIRKPEITTSVIDPTSGVSANVQRYRSFAKRYSDKWEMVMNHRNVLRSYVPEARIVWDKKLQDIIDKLEPYLRELNWAIHDQVSARNPDIDQTTKNDLNTEKKERSKIIFSRRENDEYGHKIKNIIKSAEQLLKDKSS